MHLKIKSFNADHGWVLCSWGWWFYFIFCFFVLQSYSLREADHSLSMHESGRVASGQVLGLEEQRSKLQMELKELQGVVSQPQRHKSGKTPLLTVYTHTCSQSAQYFHTCYLSVSTILTPAICQSPQYSPRSQFAQYSHVLSVCTVFLHLLALSLQYCHTC